MQLHQISPKQRDYLLLHRLTLFCLHSFAFDLISKPMFKYLNFLQVICGQQDFFKYHQYIFSDILLMCAVIDLFCFISQSMLRRGCFGKQQANKILLKANRTFKYFALECVAMNTDFFGKFFWTQMAPTQSCSHCNGLFNCSVIEMQLLRAIPRLWTMRHRL